MDERTRLLAAVYARPDDAEARLVYADWLQQRGDPRGELIALQNLAEKTDDQKARELELLEAHAEEWQGKLGTITSWYEFERGFLVGCGLRSVPDWAIGRKEWATVRHVGVADGRQHAIWALVQHRAMKSLQSLRVDARLLADDELRQLAGRKPGSDRVQELTVDGAIGNGWPALERRFPKLRKLRLKGEPDPASLARVLAPPLALELEHAVVDVDGWRVEVTRDDANALSVAVATWIGRRWQRDVDIDVLVRLLSALEKDALTSIAIELKRKKSASLSTKDAKAVAAALARQTRLSRSLLPPGPR